MNRASQPAIGSRMKPRSQAKKKVRIRSPKIAQTAASWSRTTKKRATDPSAIRIVSQRRSRGVRRIWRGGRDRRIASPCPAPPGQCRTRLPGRRSRRRGRCPACRALLPERVDRGGIVHVPRVTLGRPAEAGMGGPGGPCFRDDRSRARQRRDLGRRARTPPSTPAGRCRRSLLARRPTLLAAPLTLRALRDRPIVVLGAGIATVSVPVPRDVPIAQLVLRDACSIGTRAHNAGSGGFADTFGGA